MSNGRRPARGKKIPGKDLAGTYHMDGSLPIADKRAVKELVVMLGPLLKELGGSKKLFLTPLARYRAAPCCGDPQHLINYRTRLPSPSR